MRLFVALPVAPRVREELDAAIDGPRALQPQLRWTRPEGWHVTLAFLGEVPAEDVDGIARVMAEAVRLAPAPERLQLGGLGRFGRRVLYVAVDDEPRGVVARLGERTQSALEAAGWTPERREVRPHLTLARAGRASIEPPLVDGIELPPVADRTWRPTSVQLWSSLLGDGPARYRVEASVRVGG